MCEPIADVVTTLHNTATIYVLSYAFVLLVLLILAAVLGGRETDRTRMPEASVLVPGGAGDREPNSSRLDGGPQPARPLSADRRYLPPEAVVTVWVAAMQAPRMRVVVEPPSSLNHEAAVGPIFPPPVPRPGDQSHV